MTPKEIIQKLEEDLKNHFPSLEQRSFETTTEYSSLNSEEEKLCNIFRGLFIKDGDAKYWCYAIDVEEVFQPRWYSLLLNRIIFKIEEAIKEGK